MLYDPVIAFVLLNFFKNRSERSTHKFDFEEIPGNYTHKQIEEHLIACNNFGWIAVAKSSHVPQGWAKITSKGEVHLESLQGMP